jgi:hypothetical protein
MLNTTTDNTRIDFTIPSDNALRRIIVDPDVKSVGVWLGNKRIEQLATYVKGAKAEQAFSTPNNLTTISQLSPNVELSSIWSDFTFGKVGDANNQAKLGEVSGFGKVEKLDPLPVSHYMTETESHMIEQWAGRVVEIADPNEVTPDTPIEVEGPRRVGRTRKVKQEEDDEDEEDVDQDPPVPVPAMPPKSMNDALNSQFNAQKAKVGRTRIKKIDEDEEEEEIRDSVSISDAEEHNTWTYPPPSKSTGFGFHGMRFSKRPGRQRLVKVDSDEEDEGNTSAWPRDVGSAWRGDNGPALPEDKVAAQLRDGCTAWAVDNSSGWPDQEVPQSSNWDRSSVIAPSRNLDEDQVSNAWDETAYPDISFFGAVNGSSESKQKPVSQHDQTASQQDPWRDRHLDRNPTLAVERSPSFAAPVSKSGPGKDDQNRGRGRGRASRGQCQGPLRNAQAMPAHGRVRGTGSHMPQASNQQHRGQSHSRGTRVPRGSTPGRGPGKSNQLGRGGNKFGALAADALIDIAESDDVAPGTIPLPPGFENHQQAEQKSVRDTRYQANVDDAPLIADLIDVDTSIGAGSTRVAPPPGFESLSAAGIEAQNSNQLDRWSAVPRHGSPSASVRSQDVSSMPNNGAFYVSSSNPGMNLVEMSHRRIKQLQRDRGAAELPESSSLSEKLQDVDEFSTRTYHKTMNQQAKKPTQKKKIDQQRAEALQNAWGPSASSSLAKVSGSSAAPPARRSHVSEMSATKKKLLRGKESMASSHPEAANEEQTEQQNDHFVDALKPVFKAATAFPGTINFEVQIGQFLSPNPEGTYQSKCVTVNRWHELYDSPYGGLASAATFTNVLTRNGADVDHLLKLKIARGKPTKLFDPGYPGRLGVRFEFHCQGKNNDEFKLVFNSKGEYEIERPFRKIGQVNLHVPGQIWDAAGMLTGSTRFHEEPALKAAAEELAKSVHIPPGRKEIEVSYRLPSSNEFAVKRVVMRRISRHACTIMDKHDIQLQITEVQRLFVERRSGGIYLAYASKYEKMVEQMMIHFEVSLISDSIERAMSVNASLAVGDITSAWTEESLLQKWRTKTLLEITQIVVSKIDGVGFHNIGSAVFFINQNSVLAGGSAVAIGSQMPLNQSMTKAVTQNAQAAINVPGVRGGLAHPDRYGNAVGYGGARIPIVGGAEPDAVVPDDSASQAPGRGEAMGQGQVIPGFW